MTTKKKPIANLHTMPVGFYLVKGEARCSHCRSISVQLHRDEEGAERFYCGGCESLRSDFSAQYIADRVIRYVGTTNKKGKRVAKPKIDLGEDDNTAIAPPFHKEPEDMTIGEMVWLIRYYRDYERKINNKIGRLADMVHDLLP